MSNTAEETLAEMEEEEGGAYEQRGSENDNENENENENDDLSHEWETMARAWLCSFPEAKAVSMAEVESWIDSNLDSLPDGIKSMPRSDLSLRLISIQNMRLPNQVQFSFRIRLFHQFKNVFLGSRIQDFRCII